VGTDQQVWDICRQQGVIRTGRLLGEDVDTGTANVPLAQRGREIILIDNATPGCVDQDSV
jgi:hypothetical protein